MRFVFEAPGRLAAVHRAQRLGRARRDQPDGQRGRGTSFGVNIIPYTLAHTSFGEAAPGQRMNLEIDLIARYVARLLGAASGRDWPTR